MIDTPGIYSGIPIEIYVADKLLSVPSLSSGCAHTIESTTPLHGWTDHPRLNLNHEHDDSKTADIGSVAHDVLLEGGTDCVVIIDPADYLGQRGAVPKGWTNNAIRAARDAARAENKYPILKDDAAAVMAMVETAREFIERSLLRGIFDLAEAEATMVWQEGPVWLRARPDLLAHDRSVIVHYKTTLASVKPRSFERIAANMGYDFAMMFYARGLAELDPQAGATAQHYILGQEQKPPYSCKLFDLKAAKASIASSRVERAIDTWARCMASGKWPDYDTTVHSIEPSPWEIAEEEQTIYGLGRLDPLQAEGLQA